MKADLTDGEACIPMARREFHPAAEHQKISILNHWYVSGCLDRAWRRCVIQLLQLPLHHQLQLMTICCCSDLASQSPTVKLKLTPHSCSSFQQFFIVHLPFKALLHSHIREKNNYFNIQTNQRKIICAATSGYMNIRILSGWLTFKC